MRRYHVCLVPQLRQPAQTLRFGVTNLALLYPPWMPLGHEAKPIKRCCRPRWFSPLVVPGQPSALHSQRSKVSCTSLGLLSLSYASQGLFGSLRHPPRSLKKENRMVASKVFATAAFAGAAVAAVIPESNKVENFKQGRATIHQVERANHKNNGALSMYKTYLKYKTPIPDWLAAAVANSTGISYEKLLRRDEGSAVSTPIDTYDDAYVTPVSIGTPAQVLNLDFDTGSSDLWVFSSLTASADVDGQDTYDPDDSSTSELLSGYTWDISYGDGSSSSGVVYTDTVSIGGVTVTDQAVEAAETVSSSFTSESAIDGLLGLGFDSLNTVSPKSQSTFW